MEALSIRNVSKTYALKQKDKLSILDGISLDVKKGEFVGIIGPNGCGKTTLLKLIIGIEQPDSGSVSVLGKNPEEEKLGYVPQHTECALYPWLTVTENIAFADSQDGSCLASEKLREFGIEDYAHAYPYQLSGGIKQLVALARATSISDIFLFDEPFNALDYRNRYLVEKTFLKLRDGRNSAVLVSHDIESTVLLCDKIVVLSEKPTCIKAFLSLNFPGKRDHNTRFSSGFNRTLKQIYELLRGG